MKLPLSFVAGKLESGILLKNPLVIDAEGNRVVAIGFTPALHPATINELDTVAALFAAAPDMLSALEASRCWVGMYLGLEGHDAAARSMLAVIDAALAKVVVP